MKVESNSDSPEVVISVRQSERLSAYAKNHPEKTVVAYTARAFDRVGLKFKITWDLPPVADVPDPRDDNNLTLSYWQDQLDTGSVSAIEKDSNLLLGSANGGGISEVGGNAGLCPAGTLDQDYSKNLKEWVYSDDPVHCIYGTLHELGHNLGSSHSANWGESWNDHAEQAWYRTPCANPGNTNLCGDKEWTRKTGYEQRDLLYFSRCGIPHMEIK